jgi:hypothetical protein
MGATVLDRAVIEEGGMLGAGGLLPPGKRIGPNELWMGNPASSSASWTRGARALRPHGAALMSSSRNATAPASLEWMTRRGWLLLSLTPRRMRPDADRARRRAATPADARRRRPRAVGDRDGAHAFLDREPALRGNPGDAAFAAAMVENASTAFQDGRLADG